ncbi:MAG: SCO family protein [bacterium]|nr:SCO family protein [bacterium]
MDAAGFFRSAAGRGAAAWVAVVAALTLAAAPAVRAQLNEDAVEYQEHLGETVPGDITVRDEQGQPVTLAQLIDKPTILMMVYFECPGICTPLLNEVADILGKSQLDPRKQPFQLLAVSFEPTDTAATAQLKRANYLKLVGRPLPEETWRFLTADQDQIDRLTGAVGFRYKRAGTEYTHAGGLVIISPERKITRYLLGTEFLPFDFQMGVYEASQGTVMPTTARLMKMCFSYDPEGRKYVFNVVRVTAFVMLSSLVVFGSFLYFTTRRTRRREG